MNKHFIDTIIAMISIAGIVAFSWHIFKTLLWLYWQPFIWAGGDLQKLLIVALSHYIIVIAIGFWIQRKERQDSIEGNNHV
ncbi:hypothetical protein A8A54_04430 [Brucella pseudogrignonensis]|nr:hypothetical protein A8A54_04430 [Brucella pseudogrignonensis]